MQQHRGRNQWQWTIQRNVLIRLALARPSPANTAAHNARRWRKRQTLIVDVAITTAEGKRIRDPYLGIGFVQRRSMKTYVLWLSFLTILPIGTLIGCSYASSKSPDVPDTIRRSLDQNNLNDVTLREDRVRGVVTLGGHVTSDAEKSQAESIAKSYAGIQVVANEIAVTPPGNENEAKTIYSDFDKGIDDDLDAALIQTRLNKGVKYKVKNGVVTLTGEVNSQSRRAKVESIALMVPNVQPSRKRVGS